MLKELRIRNLAIVDSLTISFEPGLNVITGETGAGKSIIVNALELLLGGRGSSDFIRAGADEAWTEASFELESCVLLDNLGIPYDDGVIVKRVLNKSGKGRAYINDSIVTIQSLSSLGEGLVDLHGQHEQQSLLSTSTQRSVIDSFGALNGLLSDVKGLFEKYQELNSAISEIKTQQREREQRIDMLRYQINEIDAAGLKAEEKAALLAEKTVLSNLTHLRSLSETAFALLKDEDGSVLEKLSSTARLIGEINSIDGASGELLRMLEEAENILMESVNSLRALKERYDCDPERLNDVESRLALIERLERKYGEGTEGILDYRMRSEEELRNLEGLLERYEDIEKELGLTYSLLMEKSACLSDERKKTAAIIEDALKGVLTELAFNTPEFKIDFSPAEPSSSGMDRVEFLFSANPGQPPRPLNRVASGGELSRVMLALKSIFADIDDVGILIFDEVDVGIGGKTADAVARRLKDLSRRHQVVCITHLPQIASRADNHLLVTKREIKENVAVSVETLDKDERLKELARMMSGSITDTSLRHAEELLIQAE